MQGNFGTQNIHKYSQTLTYASYILSKFPKIHEILEHSNNFDISE